jgi:hypothetical protein
MIVKHLDFESLQVPLLVHKMPILNVKHHRRKVPMFLLQACPSQENEVQGYKLKESLLVV